MTQRLTEGRDEVLALGNWGMATRRWENWLQEEEELLLFPVVGVGKHVQRGFLGRESFFYMDLFPLSPLLVGHDHADGHLWDLAYGVVGHRVHNHENHGQGGGVHEDGVHEDDVHEDGVCEDGVREDGVHEDGVHEDGVHESGGHGLDHEDGVHGDGVYGDGVHLS